MDSSYIRAIIERGGLLGFFNIISGGAFGNFTIFAMSITPYINASIIMNLLTVAIPKLERLAKEGEEGRKKIAQYTRYFTVILAFIQAFGITFGLARGALLESNLWNYFVVSLTLTAGTAFLMWLGEQITERGIGNGISLIIFTSIISRRRLQQFSCLKWLSEQNGKSSYASSDSCIYDCPYCRCDFYRSGAEKDSSNIPRE